MRVTSPLSPGFKSTINLVTLLEILLLLFLKAGPMDAFITLNKSQIKN
jgi:hypothetical protein